MIAALHPSVTGKEMRIVAVVAPDLITCPEVWWVEETQNKSSGNMDCAFCRGNRAATVIRWLRFLSAQNDVWCTVLVATQNGIKGPKMHRMIEKDVGLSLLVLEGCI